ncbi:hypothetical protein GMD90_22555 [Parabacteroides merdae]|nr:hypothetical protein [Parabacteroides merdae]
MSNDTGLRAAEHADASSATERTCFVGDRPFAHGRRLNCDVGISRASSTAASRFANERLTNRPRLAVPASSARRMAAR